MANDPAKALTLFEKTIQGLDKMSNPKSAGKALLAINVFSTALGAITNTVAAATDKNTSAEDKKFLVPAGIATTIANTGLYLTLTLKTIDVLKQRANNVIKEMALKGTLKDNALKYANMIVDQAKGKKSAEEIAHMQEYLFRNGKLSKNAVAQYKDTIKGAYSVLGAFIGVIIGSGILSPLIRDVSAYFVQKHLEKRNPKYKEMPYRPYFDPGHFKVGYASRKQPLNLNNYMAFTRAKITQSNDAMKI